MKSTILFLFSIALFNTFAQDTTYYDSKLKEVESSEGAEFYEIVSRDQKNSNKVMLKNYFISGEIYSEVTYSNYTDAVKEGQEKYYYKNGQLKKESNYKSGEKNGNFSTYFQNGNLKRSDEYKDGTFISGKCFISQGKDTSYYKYYVPAVFPGGRTAFNEFLASEIKYPKDSQKKRTEGRVVVYFEIKADGSSKFIRFIKTVSEELDAEAIRVIESMPKWTPASSDGVPVNSYYDMPFNFKL